MEISKVDWKLFQEKIGGWQEQYMDKLDQEYIKIMQNEKLDPSDRFWKLEERIRKDKKRPGVELELTKADALYDIVLLMRAGAITMEDLAPFSTELKEYVQEVIKL